jgi:hypothetical protein
MMSALRSLSFFALAWIVSLLSSNLLPVCEAFMCAPAVKSVLKEETMFAGSVLQNELKWAEHAIVGYNQKHNRLPLRSSIGGAGARHVMFSQEWFDDSRYHLENNAHTTKMSMTKETPRKNLRG